MMVYCLFDSYLLLTPSYALVFLVVTMKVSASIYMPKPNPLILPPSLSISLNFNTEAQ